MHSERVKTERETELLAPAGSLECAKAAVHAGADAIYMGGPLFSARAYAESSRDGRKEADRKSATDRQKEVGRKTEADGTEEEDMLLSAIRYCHLHGVKVYMTLNTLMKEQELSGLYDYLLPYYLEGVDAVIVQDFGVFRYVREHFPDLPIHASTQMTVTGPRYAALLQKLGACRVVAARELSLSELHAIYEKTGMELEAFVHGALCYSYSGQCLMSSMIGGRSGNRGRCAGTCRLPYDVYDENGKKVNREDSRYVLSLKDFKLLERLSELMDAGVMSFKIEGRMKSPLYVATVTSVYRKYLNRILAKRKQAGTDCSQNRGAENRKELLEDQKLLQEVFDRGGTTDAYLNRHNGRDMLSLQEKEARRIPDEARLSEIRARYLTEDKKLPVKALLELKAGEKAKLSFSCTLPCGARETEGHFHTGCLEGDLTPRKACLPKEQTNRDCLAGYDKASYRITVESGQPVEAAKAKPVEREALLEKLAKLGNTAFVLKEADIHMEEAVFLPMGVINEMRRKAAAELEEGILARWRRNERTVSGSGMQ